MISNAVLQLLTLRFHARFRSYDVYTTQEPGVFEAMALVHSRIRRVVFGIPNKVDGGLGGTGMQTAVQSLPTNHHYRAFYCAPETHLYQTCKEIHSTDSS
jgi:tRNA-specific adenosine deaminase 3